MPSQYPGALDFIANALANDTPTPDVHPAHHNLLADAVMKIESELGVNPSGAFADINARLAGIDLNLSSGPISIQPTTSTIVPLTVRGATGQTASLQEWKDTNSIVLGQMKSDGGFIAAWFASPGFFNVKSFGAVGDGVANDTTPIQNAVNAFLAYIAATSKGATLYFPPGIYKITTTITFSPTLDTTSPALIRGDGANILVQTTGTPGFRFSAANGKNWRHWCLRDLQFTSTAGTPTEIVLVDDGPTGAALLYQFEIYNVSIENCGTAHGIVLHGISVGLFEFQVRNCRVWNVPNTKYGIYFYGGSSGNSSAEFYYCNVRGGLNNMNLDAGRVQITGGTFLLSRNEGIRTKQQGGNILHPHVELSWQSDTVQVAGHAAIYVEGWANCIGVESYIDGSNTKHVFHFYCYSGVVTVIGTSTIPSGGRNVAYVNNVGAAGGQVNFIGVPASAVTNVATPGQPIVAFLDAQSAANPDTSGATLAGIETEVNQIKAALRLRGVIAP